MRCANLVANPAVSQTRRTVPIMFSIELVQASERLSFTRQAEAVEGEHLSESFEDDGGEPMHGNRATMETDSFPLVVPQRWPITFRATIMPRADKLLRVVA